MNHRGHYDLQNSIVDQCENMILERGGTPLIKQREGARMRVNAAVSEYGDVWGKVQSNLRAELGEDVYSSWFARMDLEAIDGGTVYLSVPTRFLKSWIQGHYIERVLNLWRKEYAEVCNIELSVRATGRPKGPLSSTGAGVSSSQTVTVRPVRGARNGMVSSASVVEFRNSGAREDEIGSPLDSRLTFSAFVAGQGNRLAFAAAQTIVTAKTGERPYNPLFVHAAVGLGKTHLLQAIAWAARSSGQKAVYLTAERFMYCFVSALKSKSSLAFKDSLRDIDILVIDDLQFLQGRTMQDEFCHTLNALVDGAGQVVVAADRPPIELDNLDERLRSRLSAGLTVEIGTLDFEVRRDILLNRLATAKRRHSMVSIPAEVIDYVARTVKSNGRDLEGAFNRLIAQNQLTGAPVTLESAEVALKDLIRQKEPKRVRIEDIQRIVSRHYNVSKADLLSARRTRTIVRPRQVAMYLAKTLTLRSLPEIGRRFGGRDHTTVLHAVRKIDGLLESEVSLVDEINSLKRELEA